MHDRASVRGVSPSNRGNRRRRRPSKSTIKSGLKVFARAGKVAIVIAAVMFTILGLALAIDWAKTAPELAVATIEITGASRATEDSILRLANVAPGQSMLTLDVHEIERMVKAHPWIREAKVSRRFPQTVSIAVGEHEPVVLVALGHLYYANAKGEIVKRYTPGEHEVLPVITGLSREDIEAGDSDARARLVSAIDFLAEAAQTMRDGRKISEVHLDPALGLSFTMGEDEPTVVVGNPLPGVSEGSPWKTSIERYLKVREALVEKGVNAERIVIGGERRPDRAVARLDSGRSRPGSFE